MGAQRSTAGPPKFSQRYPINFGTWWQVLAPGWVAPTQSRARAGQRMRARRNDAHRDDVFQRLVDRHVEIAHPRARHDDEVAGRRVRRRRHVDAQVLLREMRAHGGRWRSGQERDRPAALMREFDEQRLAERVARIGEQRVADLLDRRVDRLDDRNAAEHVFPEMDQPRAEEIRRDYAGQQQQPEAQQYAKPRNVEAQQRVGTRPLGNQQQRLVQRRHEEVQHPDRDAERHPDQQAGDQVASHDGMASFAASRFFRRPPREFRRVSRMRPARQAWPRGLCRRPPLPRPWPRRTSRLPPWRCRSWPRACRRFP